MRESCGSLALPRAPRSLPPSISIMETSDDSGIRPLGFTDVEFYELETKVLERLRGQANHASITSACKLFNLDPFDFKDRWGPMLRNHSSSELIENITTIRPRLGDPIPDIAKDLGLPFGTVRTIVKKLMITPESPHQRTKENLAHRMMATSGGSLRDAKAQIGTVPKPLAPASHDNNDESGSSSESSESPDPAPRKPAPKTAPPVERKPPPPPRGPKVAPPAYYEQTQGLLSGIELMEGKPLSPDVQVKVLEDIHRGTEAIKACQKVNVDYGVFKNLWGAIVRLVSPGLLDASLYAIVSLSRLGYSCCKVAEALGLTRAFTYTVLSNLHLELGPSDCCSFDVTMLLVNKEMLTGSRIAELCKTPVDIGKAIVRRGGDREKYVSGVQEALEDEEAADSFLWLYERGLNLNAICTIMRLPKSVMKTLVEREVGLTEMGKWPIVVAFVLTYLCPFVMHALRESWAMVSPTQSKPDVHRSLGFDGAILGGLDFCFFLFYSGGLFIAGALGDRFSIRLLLFAGLALSATMLSIVRSTQVAGMGNAGYRQPEPYFVLFSVFGLTLSTVWPGTVAIVGSWFPAHNRGKVFGIWSSNLPLGNAAGAQVSNLVQNGLKQGWSVLLWLVSGVTGAVSVLVFLFLREKPPENDDENKRSFSVAFSIQEYEIVAEKRGVSFTQALLMPG